MKTGIQKNKFCVNWDSVKNMENPWLKLNTENVPFVLDCDIVDILDYNSQRANNYEYIIRLDNLPTPYSGDFEKAKILLLQLNPGSEILPGLEPTENHEFLVYKDLKNELQKSIRHEKMDYPFFWLNPEYILTGGFKYWSRIFSSVIVNFEDYKKIANKVCCIQYFPYHSKRYHSMGRKLYSQEYSFDLVREFIKKKDGMVILMRNEKGWLKEVPELDKKYATLKSKQNPILSKNNFYSENDYNRFLNLLDLGKG